MSAIPLSGYADDALGARNETATVATTLEQVEALRPVWGKLTVADIDSDIDHFMTVVRHADQVIRPHVVHIRREDGPDMIAVARLENLPVTFRFGYRIFGRAALRAIVVSFDGILGARSRADEVLALKHLTSAFKNGDADLLLLRNVDLESSLHEAAVRAAGIARRVHAQPVAPRWIAAIPDTLEQFLQTRSVKTRQTLRRHERRLVENYGERLLLRRWDRLEDMAEMCRDMESVASRTYQRGLGVGFAGYPMQLALIELGLRRGWHRTWMLYLDGRPVAFWTGSAYGGTFFVGTPGFDPDFVKESVGRFTMLRMIGDLCADPDVTKLDFGHGDAEYKSAFGQCVRMESDVMLAAGRASPMLVILALSTLSFLNNQVRRLAVNFEWGRRLKAGWRRRMAGGG